MKKWYSAISFSLVIGLTGFLLFGASSRTNEPLILKGLDKDLAPFAFLAGSWGIQKDGMMQEEHWTQPVAGTMVGMHRDIFPNGKSFFEFLRIVKKADGIYYMAQPLGREPTAFRFKEGKEGKVVFENPDHDFPQRIIYWIDPSGNLAARIEGTQNGKEAASEWRWQRANIQTQ